VRVIDQDQGHSGTTAEGRQGFQELLAQVSLDHVGVVLGIEMSRLARCCRDWHQLLELCALFGTLLADQDGLYDAMTAAENIGFYLRLYDVPADPARIDEVLRLVGLADRADDLVGTFSSGMRKRTALARAVAHHPAVIVLDEPTSGVDPAAQAEIRDLLLEIARQENTAILLSSHNLEEVQRLCNRVAIIAGGQVQLTGDLATLRERMGDQTLTVIATEPVPEPALATLRAAHDLGLREVEGTRLRFAPGAGVRTTTVIARLADAGVDVEHLTTNDASLEDMFASVVAQTPSDPAPQDADAARGHRRGRDRRLRAAS